MNVKALAVKVFFVAAVFAGLQGCENSGSTVSVASSDCWLDAINDNTDPVVQSAPGTIKFRGWAADSTTGTAPSNLSVYVTADKGGESVIFKADKRTSRNDVVVAMKQPKYEMSGFDFSADASSLALGEHTLSLVMSREGATVTCKVTKKLFIK